MVDECILDLLPKLLYPVKLPLNMKQNAFHTCIASTLCLYLFNFFMQHIFSIFFFLSQLLQDHSTSFSFVLKQNKKQKSKQTNKKIIRQTKNKKHAFKSKTKQNMESILCWSTSPGCGVCFEVSLIYSMASH